MCFQIETEEIVVGQDREKEREIEDLINIEGTEAVVEIEKEEDLGPGKEEIEEIDTIEHIKIEIKIEGPILRGKIKNANQEGVEKMSCPLKKQINYEPPLD